MEKSFNKHYLEKDPSSGRVRIGDDDKPVVGKLAKADCRLEQRHVDILNRGWKKSGVYFVSSKEQDEANRKTEAEKKEKVEVTKGKDTKIKEMKDEIERLNLELKAKTAVVKSEARLNLEAEAKGLDVNFRSDISDEKLIERINEKKK